MSVNKLFEEFCRKHRITGSNSNMKQVNRLIRHFLEFMQDNYPDIKHLDKINYDHKNAYYNHLKNECWKGNISKSYLKDNFYAVNKLFKAICKTELVYDVPKIMQSVDGNKKITVTKEEYNNIKIWRRKYGKILPPT